MAVDTQRFFLPIPIRRSFKAGPDFRFNSFGNQ
jgi:hypothetical protein